MPHRTRVSLVAAAAMVTPLVLGAAPEITVIEEPQLSTLYDPALLTCTSPAARGRSSVLLLHGAGQTPESNWTWSSPRYLHPAKKEFLALLRLRRAPPEPPDPCRRR